MQDRLLEREAEIDALQAAARNAGEGSGRLVVVAGPGGIGKSRLLAAGRASAKAQGLRVLSARCSELERSFPFGAVRQLFEPLLRAEPDDALFEGAAALAAPLFEPGSGAPDDEDTLFSRLHGLHWLVANLAAREPLLLSVDDAHWADEASLRFLTFLATRIAELPAVLLVGTRPADDPTADPAVGALLTDPEALQLRPPPLSEAAVARLLEGDEPPDEAFVLACHEATGGNPFLLRELLTAIAAEGLAPRGSAVERVRSLGPAGIATTIGLRLQRLAPAAVDLARALAILGDGVDVRTAAAFAGLEEPDALEAARVLEAAGVAGAEEGLRFVHPIVRQSVYRSLTAVERGEGHAEAARFMAARGAAPDVVAAHLLQAPPRGDAEAVRALRAAAARAEALGDPLAAAEQLRRALAEPPPDDERAAVLLALGRAAARAGLADAAEHLEACLALEPEPDVLVTAAETLAELRQFSGRPDLAADVVEPAIGRLGADSPGGRRLTAALISAAHVSVPARRRLLPWIGRLSDPGTPAATREEFVALSGLAGLAIMDHNDGRTAADRGLRALAAPLPDWPDAAARSVRFCLAVALMGAEEFNAAEALLGRMLDAGRRAGARGTVASVTLLRALVRYRSGHVALAEADAVTGIELLPEAHGAEMMADAGTAAAVLAGIERERPPATLQAILEDTPYTRDPDILPYTQILLARGTLHQAAGEHAQALRAFEACDRDEPGWASNTPSIVWWRSGAALSLHALGREDEALALAREELELARAAGPLARSIGIAERAVALVGPAAERAAGLEAAAQTLADIPLEQARALVDLGGELRRGGDRRGARDALTRAHALSERVGATRLAKLARHELRAAGARPTLTAGHGLSGLTPAERRVAELAGAGQTNREIAQTLFVSEKTVETHLARVFRKLDLSSRRQLPDVLRT